MGSAPLKHIINIADIVVEENHDIDYDLHKNLRGFPIIIDT